MQQTVARVGKQATDLEKLFAKDMSDKGLSSKICKELVKPNNKKKKILKAKELNRHLIKKICRYQINIWTDIPHYVLLGNYKLQQADTTSYL